MSSDSVDISSVYREFVHESTQWAKKRTPRLRRGPAVGSKPLQAATGGGGAYPRCSHQAMVSKALMSRAIRYVFPGIR